MTTVMLVAAMIPIALGQGPGAGARASMAKVIIGGQMLSLVLALLVTPVFYALLDMMKNLARRLGIRFSVEPHGARRPASTHRPRPTPADGAGVVASPRRRRRRPTPDPNQPGRGTVPSPGSAPSGVAGPARTCS